MNKRRLLIPSHTTCSSLDPKHETWPLKLSSAKGASRCVDYRKCDPDCTAKKVLHPRAQWRACYQMLPVFLNPKKECDPKVMSLAVFGGFMFSVFNHLNGLSPVTKWQNRATWRAKHWLTNKFLLLVHQVWWMYKNWASKPNVKSISFSSQAARLRARLTSIFRSEQQETYWVCHIYPLVNYHSYGKSPFFMGKSTILMAIFNSFLYVYQRVSWILKRSGAMMASHGYILGFLPPVSQNTKLQVTQGPSDIPWS